MFKYHLLTINTYRDAQEVNDLIFISNRLFTARLLTCVMSSSVHKLKVGSTCRALLAALYRGVYKRVFLKAICGIRAGVCGQATIVKTGTSYDQKLLIVAQG